MILNPLPCIASNASCAFSTRKAICATPGPPAILFENLLHRRLWAQRLEQLDQVGSFADLQQRFAHLVAAIHFFAVDLAKAEHLVGLHLVLQRALRDRDGHVINKLDARYFCGLIADVVAACCDDGGVIDLVHLRDPPDPAALFPRPAIGYSNSSSTWCTLTELPGTTFTLLIVPRATQSPGSPSSWPQAPGRTSFACTVCPGTTLTVDHQSGHRTAAHFRASLPLSTPPVRVTGVKETGGGVVTDGRGRIWHIRVLAFLVFQDLDLRLVGLPVDGDPQPQSGLSSREFSSGSLRPQVVRRLNDDPALLCPRAYNVAGRNGSG